MWLTRLSITRPVTILMLVIALVVLGLQSRSRLPVDLMPDIDFPMLFISTAYPGTGPEEIETLITKPVEDQISTISGLKKLTSTSSEGVSTIRMEFEIGTNLDEVTADVRSKLDALRSTLPQDSKAPMVVKLDVGAMPVISLSLASKRRDSIELRRMADDILKDRLAQLNGVASVGVSGGDMREIRVEVDKNRLEAYGLSITQVVNALKSENLNLPSGSIEETRRTSAVRVMGEFDSPEEILNVRISNALGNPNLRIRDIAEVRDTIVKRSSFTRVDGGDSVAMTVQKQSNSNTVLVVDEVRKELEKLTGKEYVEKGGLQKIFGGHQPGSQQAAVIPNDVEIKVAMDQSTYIRETLRDVYQSLVEGALLAVLIVFLFLHSGRGTFIVALAIPTSMIATFMVMDWMGFSINQMSMLGLSLCVGILVDDSIVVLENIHRHLKMGESPREAAINGRSEIGLAALTITMVDVVVFVPVAFMGGIVGQFFRQFGIVVAAATLFSLFISFTLTPMLASRWLKSHEEELAGEKYARDHHSLFQAFVNAWEAIYGTVDRTYRVILAWALDHRAVVICLGFMTMIASFGIMMPKPAIKQLIFGLPVILIALAVIFAIWYFARMIHGWVRIPFFLVGFICSIVIAAIANKASNVGTPMIMVLMLVLLLAIIAYGMSHPGKTKAAFSMSRVTKPLAIWTVGLLLICLLVPAKFGFEFVPKTDQRQFSITIERAVGTSLNVTDATTKAIEADLLNTQLFPETKTVFTTVGSSGSGRITAGAAGTDTAEINVELVDYVHGKNRTSDEVMLDINQRYKDHPGVKVTAAEQGGFGGAPINIEVSGLDGRRTQTVANQILDIVKATEGTYAATLSSKEGRPEYQAHIDRDRAAQYGISVAQIASALRTSLEGDTSTKFREGGKEYDIRIYLPQAQRENLTQLPNMVVGATATGQPVYLNEVVSLRAAAGPTKVERSNRQRSISVQAQLTKDARLGNLQQVINMKIAGLNLQGATVTWAGQAEMMAESFGHLQNALMLSVLLVFMLMAALFESLLSPLIIMMAVPQAMAGALFALGVSGKSLSIVTMIGLIMLVGLVTKNAILMVDYTNTLRKEQGKKRRDALQEAGPTRLRPILMTTMAMIFGMLPTALALSKGAEFRQPMAIAVIGGLILSMFLTLLMVPVFYEIFDDINQWIGRLFGRRPEVEDPGIAWDEEYAIVREKN